MGIRKGGKPIATWKNISGAIPELSESGIKKKGK